MTPKIELKESKNGFSERDLHSKAILNKDSEMLLKYKIQKNKYLSMSSSVAEMENLKNDFQMLKNELSEIKTLLRQISEGKTWQ